MFEPVIKWSGSKRSQAEEIIKRFPKEIDTYYEPFCGGASVLYRLLRSNIKVNRYICSDINKDLINLWNTIKDNPNEILSSYEILWNELNKDDDIKRKRIFFEKIRARYNEEHNPCDFMFIMRTTTNGMPRYNQDGNFNNSFHITRDGINPETFSSIVYEWSNILKLNDVTFFSSSYCDIVTRRNDFIYLDPPYANTKGMYYGTIDYRKFWDWLRKQPCDYVLSFDGISGDIDNTYAVPKDVYTSHEYLFSGNSSFKRTIGKSSDSVVYESLYCKRSDSYTYHEILKYKAKKLF